MSVHRRFTALLAALSTLAGGPLAAPAVADSDADAETNGRGPRTVLRAAPPDHAATQARRAAALATALGVSEERLGVVLRELRSERRAGDVAGARPAVRTGAQLAAERAGYAAALAAKVDCDPAAVAAALDAPDDGPPAPAPRPRVPTPSPGVSTPGPGAPVPGPGAPAARPGAPAPGPGAPAAPLPAAAPSSPTAPPGPDRVRPPGAPGT